MTKVDPASTAARGGRTIRDVIPRHDQSSRRIARRGALACERSRPER